MEKARVFILLLMLVSMSFSLLAFCNFGYAESVNPAVISRSVLTSEPLPVLSSPINMERVLPIPVPVSEPAKVVEPETWTMEAPLVIENPRTLTLDGLRRQQYLYPDSSLADRMIQTESDIPPLFD